MQTHAYACLGQVHRITPAERSVSENREAYSSNPECQVAGLTLRWVVTGGLQTPVTRLAYLPENADVLVACMQYK